MKAKAQEQKRKSGDKRHHCGPEQRVRTTRNKFNAARRRSRRLAYWRSDEGVQRMADKARARKRAA